jgi:subtilisin family serine protease
MFSRHGCAALVAVALLVSLACVSSAGAARVPRASTDQWALSAIGSQAVWQRAQGKGVTVAVVDSGVDMGHKDLAPNLWTNQREIPGNGIDDDHNGYVDDVHGYDFVDGDGDPSDQNGHGTHVAGIIAGACKTVCGVAPKAQLMVIRVLDANADGRSDKVAGAVRYAVDEGARIVNLSLAGSAPDPDLQAAVDYAAAHGVIVVAAAGNNSGDADMTPSYPAASNSPNLISVACTDSDGSLSQISNYGPRSITVAAPGAEIVSTAMGGGRQWRSGTSMAAAVVSGALADLASGKRGSDWQQLRASIVYTARPGLPVKSGRLRLDKALDKLAGKVKKRHKKHTGRHSRRSKKK